MTPAKEKILYKLLSSMEGDIYEGMNGASKDAIYGLLRLRLDAAKGLIEGITLGEDDGT